MVRMKVWLGIGVGAATAIVAVGAFGVAVGAAARALPNRAGAVTRGHFKTPSGNIFCGYFHEQGRAGVDCVIRSSYKPPLPRRGAKCSRDYWVSLDATGRVETEGSVCPGEDDPEGPFIGAEHAWILNYGKTWSGGGLQCSSALTGLTCRNKSGHGFFLSRERWRRF